MIKNKKVIFENSIQLRVRYSETDQMGYCYYGNYAQYLEVGRVETMRNLGMPYKSIEKQGVMMPVTDFSIKYISPAYYDDLLTITTRITHLSGVRMYFEYTIKNENNHEIATAKTTLVFVDLHSKKPTHPPQDLLQLLDLNT